MLKIKIRPKHQLTLPASIVRAARLQPEDKLLVGFTNGVITLTPQAPAHANQSVDLSSYAGMCQGMWGQDAEAVNAYVRELRS